MHASRYPLHERQGELILNLCVSDLNKSLLLNAEGFIPLLLDSLLLDPEHPRRSDANTDFDAVCGPVQRDYAEAIAQLAMFAPGREALLRQPTQTGPGHARATRGAEAAPPV